jgi:uncharacterized protein YqgV (UPF0045/DUF77 family)
MIQTQEKDYSRDPTTLALINTNIKAFQEHKLKRKQEQRLKKIEDDMESIMKTLQDLKEALSELGVGKENG